MNCFFPKTLRWKCIESIRRRVGWFWILKWWRRKRKCYWIVSFCKTTSTVVKEGGMSSFRSVGERAETNGVSHHTSWLMSVYNLYSNQPTFLCRAAVVIKAARWLFLLLQHFTNSTEVPYFSPDEHTHTHTEIHTPPLSLARHVGAMPVLCPLRRERFWSEPGWKPRNVPIASDSVWVTGRVSSIH